MKSTIALWLLVAPFALVAQKKDKVAMKAASSITVADMQRHLYTIASAEMEGRDTPSPGLEKAANYIEDHFKSLGLTPGNNGSYRQYYPLYRDSMTYTAVTINGKTLQTGNDFQPLTSNYTAGMRFGEIVFAGFGVVDGEEYNDYKDLNVAGKLVLIADGSPVGYKPKPGTNAFNSPASLNGKLATAMSRGAAAVLIIHSNFPRKVANTTSNWSMNGFKNSQP
jgi:hypothetical protein